MNAHAIPFESLTVDDSGFQLPENNFWQCIFDIKQRLVTRYAKAGATKRERKRIRELDARLIESSRFVYYG